MREGRDQLEEGGEKNRSSVRYARKESREGRGKGNYVWETGEEEEGCEMGKGREKDQRYSNI